MAIDREKTLRNAEKLLRQGKLDAAIAEYLRVIEDQPRDWNTANILGDLYVRAGHSDKAVAQYTRIADHLAHEGFMPKAAALYKKIVKIKPDDEYALLQSAEISARQGLLADAKAYFASIAERRKARGDRRGAAELRIRMGSLDPGDLDGRVAAARASAEIGDLARAAAELKEVASELEERGKRDEALEVLREAAGVDPSDRQVRASLIRAYLAQGDVARAREHAGSAAELKDIAEHLFAQGVDDQALEVLADAGRLDPGDQDTRNRLAGAYIARGDFARAREVATTAAQFRAIAATLAARGEQERALEALVEAARLDPSDVVTRLQLARAYLAQGDMERARPFLDSESLRDDVDLLLTVAEFELRNGHVEAGESALRRVLEVEPDRRDQLVLLACNVADVNGEGAFRAIDVAAEAALARADWAAAAAAFHEFVTRVPNHIPALMKLVEICVDGGLEATMFSAQAQLADAYLAAGCGAEARVIAEDLVAREPWERSNIERFRRALTILGEPNPDAIIAERLSGESPFTSTDLLLGLDEPSGVELEPAAGEPPEAGRAIHPPDPAARPALVPVEEPGPAVDQPAPRRRAPATSTRKRRSQADEAIFKLSANAIDLSSILGEEAGGGTPPEAASDAARPEAIEVDLSDVLEEMKPGATQAPDAPAATPPRPERRNLDEVFEDFRQVAIKQTSADSSAEQYTLALKYRESGLIDEAVRALEAAVRAPRLRFDAGRLLAAICLERGMRPQAIEWMERAAEAPAPTLEAGRELLYDLGQALEAAGETARALAVFLELQADAGDYRDVSRRVQRLSKVQA